MRLRTLVTGEDYVTGKLWARATISSCPWCPAGRCTLRRHGTYERVTPAGCHVPRWYCPATGRTVSALPDCLAAQRTGTLAEREAALRSIEDAGLAGATRTERTDVLLPGALRFLSRLRTDLYAVLAAIRGLDPERFTGCAITLAAFAAVPGTTTGVFMTLRADHERHLGTLPAPLGFEVTRLVHESKTRPIVIIDEAHHLRTEVLEDLRLLTNYEMDSDNRLCLLFIGLTDLRRRIAMAAHESLQQRIVVRFHLEGLGQKEIGEYLAHRLRAAGTELPLFEPAATEAIYQATRALPRRINRLAHYALTAAAIAKARSVTAEHVAEAMTEIGG